MTESSMNGSRPRPAEKETPRIFLLAGLALAAASNGNHASAAAAWLFPVFLLRYYRTRTVGRGAMALFPGLVLAAMIMVFPMTDLSALPLHPRLAAATVWGLRYFLPFLADRLLAGRLSGPMSTAVFPLAWTSLEYLSSLGPEGTWGSLAVTQFDLAPLNQLASVTGPWGIVFLMTWLASATALALEGGFAGRASRAPVLAALGLLGAVLIFGQWRLETRPGDEPAVLAAGLTKARDREHLFDVRAPRETVCAEGERDRIALLARTRLAARLGARIVVWQEYAVLLPEENESALIADCRRLAVEEGITLVAAYGVFPPDFPAGGWQNVALGVEGSTGVVRRALKTFPSQALEAGATPGDGRLAMLDTPHGRVGIIVCTDQDHPQFVRQAGQNGVFAILVPSLSWPGVTPLHTRMAALRAVENGCALCKVSGQGLSACFDRFGRRLPELEPNGGPVPDLTLCRLPLAPVTTVYAMIGDAFAWTCLAASAALMARAIFSKKRRGSKNDTTSA